MNDCVLFNFESKDLRSIKDEQGIPWFVAKDVCDILEHTNHRVAVAALEDDEKGVRKVYTLGGLQEMLVINESGVWTLIIRSNLPQARRLRKWLTSDVIPALYRTGSYSAPPPSTALIPSPPAPLAPPVPVIPQPTIDAAGLAKEVKAWKSISRSLNFSENQSILFTCNAIKRRYSVDLLEILGAPKHFVAENQESKHFSVTELAARLGNSYSAVKLNKLLKAQGFQIAERDSKNNLTWKPTPKSAGHHVLCDTGKAHKNSGLPVCQLRWYATILDQLELSPPASAEQPSELFTQ